MTALALVDGQALRPPRTETSAMVGLSAPMVELQRLVGKVAASRRPVLVVGPTGSGKELVVREIHERSAQADEPLIELNCSTLPETLAESILFGHARGAFTGADRESHGLLGATKRGTLFLDEIAELPLAQQAKLLRVLESGRYRPVGALEERVFDGRVVAATHVNLEARVAEGRFREDLFHRLAVLPVRVPSLDERRDDVPLLVAHFCRQQPEGLELSADAMASLCAASWPGNVRQLRNAVDRIAVMADERPVSAASVRQLAGLTVPVAVAAPVVSSGADRLQAANDQLIRDALAASGGNKTAAARQLGVHRKVVERWAVKHVACTNDYVAASSPA